MPQDTENLAGTNLISDERGEEIVNAVAGQALDFSLMLPVQCRIRITIPGNRIERIGFIVILQ
jgi:hypothetical protein